MFKIKRVFRLFHVMRVLSIENLNLRDFIDDLKVTKKILKNQLYYEYFY